MKNSIYFIILFCMNLISAQDEIKTKEIKSKVDEVTVFLKGAQITRNAEVEVGLGKTLLKFTELSPFIRSKTVQVKSTGDVTVLSVNHSKNNLEKLEKSSEHLDLENERAQLAKDIRIEKTHLDVIKEEISFLQENKSIGGNNETLLVEDLRAATDFYSKRLTTLKLNEIKRRENLFKLEQRIGEIDEQINNISSSDNFVKGEIHVMIEAKKASNSNLILNYLVDNAGWNPSYDIRAKNVKEPIDLLYKANVRQDTKVDWNDVKLTFSSVDPSTSGIAPELKTYYLDYFSLPPRYGKTVTEVSGFVYDSDKLSLPGASITVKGSTIGTQTDFDGFYSIAIPDGNSQLEYRYIGFNSQIVPITSEYQNVYLEENKQSLEEVVVRGYAGSNNSSIERTLSGKVAGVEIDAPEEYEDVESETIPVQLAKNQTSVEFTIDQPYSVKSDNQNFAVDIKRYEMPASYQYYSVPKVQKAAYLLASIIDWQQYSMLEGEANIFFENTYVGKTILDTRYSSDTLEISLGQDKSVSVDRKIITDYSSKKMVGSRKEESKHWNISVRNNKSEQINLLLMDQVPVSRMDEIKVEVEQKSGAKLNPNSGELHWNLTIDANDKKDVDLKYSVKYPKNKNLTIE